VGISVHGSRSTELRTIKDGEKGIIVVVFGGFGTLLDTVGLKEALKGQAEGRRSRRERRVVV
jgi:hypothetical protein